MSLNNEIKPISISDFKKLFNTKSKQVFLTGPAGTGKSYTVNLIKSHFHNPVVLSSTNSSAIEVGGDTVHSFFKLGMSSNKEQLEARDNAYIDWFCKNVKSDRELARRSMLKSSRDILSRSELVIIDEISMISAECLDLIMLRLEEMCISINILFVGDLYQLPPVKARGMVFESKYWNPQVVELCRIKRTSNLDYSNAQKSMRRGLYTERVHNLLLELSDKCLDDLGGVTPVYLLPTNEMVDFMNTRELDRIDSELIVSRGHIWHDPKMNAKSVAQLTKEFPTTEVLSMKLECRVIMVATVRDDNGDRLFVNGDTGTIKEFDDDSNVMVLLDRTGELVKVSKHQFSKYKIQLNDEGVPVEVPEITLTQYPFRVAYAMTIHRSQGKSIPYLHIDCKGLFQPSQFYVAISRGTDPRNVVLRNFNRNLLRVDKRVKDYYDSNKESIHRVDSVVEDDCLKLKTLD